MLSPSDLQRPRGFVLLDIFDLAEDADYSPTAPQRNCAYLDGQALAVRVQDDALVVRARPWSDEISGEDLPRPARFLGRDDRGELAAANVSDQLRAAGFSQRMIPCRSITYAGTRTRSIASSISPPRPSSSDIALSLLLALPARNQTRC
jgi:hypothetical protein